MQSLIRRIETISSPEQLLLNESMASHTTIRVGGPADAFYMPESVEQLRQSLDWARSLSVPVLLMGNGSNLIVRDGGVRGLVVALGERFSRIRVEGDELTAQAGVALHVSPPQEAGLRLEFAAGIPGRSAAARR